MPNVAPPPSGWEVRHVDTVSARAEVSEDKKIRGTAIVFDSRSLDLGGFREVIAPSAVDRTLREGHDVRAYFDHDQSKVLGRYSAGTLKMKKQRRGLEVEIDPPRTSLAKDLLVSIARGDISGMSFRFRVMPDGETWDIAEDDVLVRTIHDMVFAEVSVVSEPAYVGTSAEARAAGDFAVALASYESFLKAKDGRGLDWFQRRLKVAGIR